MECTTDDEWLAARRVLLDDVQERLWGVARRVHPACARSDRVAWGLWPRAMALGFVIDVSVAARAGWGTDSLPEDVTRALSETTRWTFADDDLVFALGRVT